MSNLQNLLVTVSFIGWLGIAIFELIRRKNWESFGIQIPVILIVALVLNRWFGYFNTTEIKGFRKIGEGWLVIGLYLSTIMGIVAHHIFVQTPGLDAPEERTKLRWTPLLKPFVISPLIFLSALSQLNKVSAQADTLIAALMQFGFAFQNGFFWKAVFEQFQGKPAPTQDPPQSSQNDEKPD
jgi:hypothetical protein